MKEYIKEQLRSIIPDRNSINLYGISAIIVATMLSLSSIINGNYGKLDGFFIVFLAMVVHAVAWSMIHAGDEVTRTRKGWVGHIAPSVLRAVVGVPLAYFYSNFLEKPLWLVLLYLMLIFYGAFTATYNHLKNQLLLYVGNQSALDKAVDRDRDNRIDTAFTVVYLILFTLLTYYITNY